MSAFGHKRTLENPQENISSSSTLSFIDVVVLFVSQKEDDVNKRSKRFLTFLLYAAIVSNSACSTTTQRIGPSQAALDNYGIGKGDYVLVRYANMDDPRSSSSSELIEVTNISDTSISGTRENGNAIDIGYDEIFQIEIRKKGAAIRSDSPALVSAGTAAGKTLEVVAKAALVAFCIAAASGGVSCY